MVSCLSNGLNKYVLVSAHNTYILYIVMYIREYLKIVFAALERFQH